MGQVTGQTQTGKHPPEVEEVPYVGMSSGATGKYKYHIIFSMLVNSTQGTNVVHNVRGGLLIDLTIVAIALLLRYTLSMSLKLTDITQWNVGAVVLEQF